ncbi:MAG: flavin reductase family protein [Halanaerobiales bacterium]|nr:flavin reductase family protein [Halanaerobiales bacterium]
MKTIKFNEFQKKIMEVIKKGAFLTVKDRKEINTMTIGWGSIGVIWGIPIFTVLVRDSRYTHKLIENSDQFTVSIPFKGQFKKELNYCGTYSGRDVDKFEELDLEIINGKKIDTPFIKGNDIHYECEVVYKQDMDKSLLFDQNIKNKFYPSGDYHTVYYGKIIGTYQE